MTELQLFKNPTFGEIRTLEENGRVLFCGNDVATALGYVNVRDAVARHCRGVVKRDAPHPQSTGKTIEMSFIPESDVYRLVFGSKMPNAEAFTDWVTEEILPTIRKTGGYVNDDELFARTYLPNADEATVALFKTTLATVRNLNAKIESDKPKVLFADAVSTADTSILIGELAKLIKQTGVDIGQNRLFDWLRRNGYLIRRSGSDFNMPTQRAMERGLFEIKERTFQDPNGSVKTTKTVKVTGKGQVYFVQKFLGRSTGVV